MENGEHGELTEDKKEEGKAGAESVWKKMKKSWGMQAGTNATFASCVLQTLKSLFVRIKKDMKLVRIYLCVLPATICNKNIVLKR